MNILIRPVRTEDLEAVTAVEATCFPAAEAAGRASIEKRIQTFPERFFVAELSGEIIGLVNGATVDSRVIYDELFDNASLHKPEGTYQAIFGLDVMPGYRNQGIAAKLLNHMIEAARQGGQKGLILTCKEHLTQYYEKFGFVNLGLSESSHGGAAWYDMVLEFQPVLKEKNSIDMIAAIW